MGILGHMTWCPRFPSIFCTTNTVVISHVSHLLDFFFFAKIMYYKYPYIHWPNLSTGYGA